MWGGVVLCIVLFSTPIDTYVSYALNRIFDTGVGVIAAFAVNYFLPQARVVALRSRVEGLLKNVMKKVLPAAFGTERLFCVLCLTGTEKRATICFKIEQSKNERKDANACRHRNPAKNVACLQRLL